MTELLGYQKAIYEITSNQINTLPKCELPKIRHINNSTDEQ